LNKLFILIELVDEYQLIWIDKSSKKSQQRFEQLRQQKVKIVLFFSLFKRIKKILFLIENPLSTIQIKNKFVEFFFYKK